MSPNGTRCQPPSTALVVTMLSRMSGTPSALHARTHGVPRLLERGRILERPVGGAAPVERLVLGVTLAEAPGDLGLGELGAEIEGVRGIALDRELREKRKGVGPDRMDGAIVDVHAVLGDGDAVVG